MQKNFWICILAMIAFSTLVCGQKSLKSQKILKGFNDKEHQHHQLPNQDEKYRKPIQNKNEGNNNLLSTSLLSENESSSSNSKNLQQTENSQTITLLFLTFFAIIFMIIGSLTTKLLSVVLKKKEQKNRNQKIQPDRIIEEISRLQKKITFLNNILDSKNINKNEGGSANSTSYQAPLLSSSKQSSARKACKL